MDVHFLKTEEQMNYIENQMLIQASLMFGCSFKAVVSSMLSSTTAFVGKNRRVYDIALSSHAVIPGWD